MKRETMTAAEREALLLSLLRRLYAEELSEGQLLRALRRQVLGLSQDDYARLVGVSRRTLSDIERDVASTSLSVLNRVFKPLGLRAGVMPRQAALLQKLQDPEA